MIKGIQVILIEKIKTSIDEFDNPIYEKKEIVVDNVLVGQPTSEEAETNQNLYGKRTAYTLAIPKGDNHNWVDTEVKFFNQTFRTIGEPIQGIEVNIPLKWNKKVHVERYG